MTTPRWLYRDLTQLVQNGSNLGAQGRLPARIMPIEPKQCWLVYVLKYICEDISAVALPKTDLRVTSKTLYRLPIELLAQFDRIEFVEEPRRASSVSP